MRSASRTRVKICGITRREDALAAVAAGADALGLVFYASSPRAVDVAQARALVAVLPPFVSTVGLFVNATVEDVQQVLQAVPLDLLQFHGDETPGYCAAFGRPWLKALRMEPALDLDGEMARFAGAQGILFDAWHDGLYGGTGESFDWQRLQNLTGDRRLILAGGLTPDNVATAIRQVRPWAVDVSSGVETAPGLKSGELLQRFINEVHSV